MICCLCGVGFEANDAVLKITQHKLVQNNVDGRWVMPKIPLEDGSGEKYAHSICPVEFGAPLAMIGADGDRYDV